jgi:hypothetical protein
VAEQAPGVGDADLGAVRELARLAEVVHERRADEQARVQARVQLADVERKRPDGDRMLERAAKVGVVALARARRAPPTLAQRRVVEQRVQQGAQPDVVDIAREVLEEAVELVEVAVGDRQERGRIGLAVGRGPRACMRRPPRAPARLAARPPSTTAPCSSVDRGRKGVWRHRHMMYLESDAALDLGESSRRTSRPGDHLRLQRLERRR